VQKGITSCSLFAVYDGHGGADCCNFLKEKLHSYLLTSFDPLNFHSTLRKSCVDLDEEFLKKARSENYCDTSGSCALALLAIGRPV
jgi:serine/threonine protein phosphatase PrpC